MRDINTQQDNAASYRNDSHAELKRQSETVRVGELETYGETEQSNNASKKRAVKKRSGIGGLSAVFAAVVSAVVLAMTATGTGTDKTVVTFDKVTATDTTIGYELSFDKRTEDALTVVVYNDFTKREQTVTGDVVWGEVTGLKSGLIYQLAVKSGDQILATKEVRTLTPEEMPVTKLHSVTAKCTCIVDGLFRFTMDFIDEAADWSDFRATLTDASGVVSHGAFTEDPRAEQTISVTEAGIKGFRAQLKIYCTSIKSDGEILVYDASVLI